MAESHADLPPTRTIEPIDPPPQSRASTTAQLKADIDSGRTGDKAEVYDPGLSPLGTDDEAAGRPPSPERINLARQTEGQDRFAAGDRRASYAHHRQNKALWGFVAFIGLAALVFLSVYWLK
ncbi:hypothetical protein [Methylobacterium oryzisoli]|uniref:hypothetical protein n=1 Tax=Methylobacterium oryzisoli TaxID=3385502 RepID=UPI003892188C